ncbi:MAG: aminotransferase class I/II-fold pyridoxal phosphate-dependent enzyme [bacterium]|nr:aminotransferase class I/II-fold pyridoxal phosphate-dependent enzyme [bacterium]
MTKLKRDFELEIFFSKWEFKARYNIGCSDMQSMKLSELLELADQEDLQKWNDTNLGYTETTGLPELKEVIAGTYNSVTPDDILCFAGAEEGIFCAMHALLEPGDHAIVCYPNYQSLETLPVSTCEVTGIYLDPDQNWTIDMDLLRSVIRPNTKLIVINFPNNPTGKILEKDKFDEIIELCRKQGIYLFSDEVYRLIEREPSMRLPQAADLYDRALSLNVMSKAYGLAGLRIGWIASKDRSLLRSMERVKHYLSICNSAPSEVLAMIALKARDIILDKNRTLVNNNLKSLNDFFIIFTELFEWYIPDGGCIGFPRYKGPGDVDTFVTDLLEKEGIILLPASVYISDLGAVPQDRFRIGYGKNYMAEALDILTEYLNR